MPNRIKIYTCVAMTGRMMDEMVVEAEMLKRTFVNYGFECLSPVLEENIPNVHEILSSVPAAQLAQYWKRDKEMIREADVVLDYKTRNKSDGSNKELGYARYCLWKPVIRVWDGPGALISRMEDDLVVPTLSDALNFISTRWGNYEKLGMWHKEIWDTHFSKWLNYHMSMKERYQNAIC